MFLLQLIEVENSLTDIQVSGSRSNTYTPATGKGSKAINARRAAKRQATYERNVRSYNKLPASQRKTGKVSTKGFAPASRGGAKKAAAKKKNTTKGPKKK